MNRKMLMGAVFVLVFAVNGIAVAQGPGSGICNGTGSQKGCRGGAQFDRAQLLQELNLTAEQRGAMQGFRARNMALRERQRGIFAKRMELNQLLRAAAVDDQAVRAKATELQEEMASVQGERIENLLTLRRTLEPEQFAKLMDKLTAAFGRGGSGTGGPGERGGMFMKRRLGRAE